MTISNVNKSLEIQTITTDVINWSISYDIVGVSSVELVGNDGSISTITDTTILPNPTIGNVNEVKSLIIENTSTNKTTVAIRSNTSGVRIKIFEAILSPGENINYTVKSGFSVRANDGSLKIFNTSTTFENFITANKQKITMLKTVPRTTVAATSFSMFDLAGNPGAGVLAGTSTTSGVVPTDTTVGFPLVNSFSATKGNIGAIQFSNTVASRLTLYDMLFKAGAYGFATGTTTLSAQPSYASRIPTNSNYNDTEIWVEVTTAFVTVTAWRVQVTYTNQSGVSNRTSIISPAQSATSLTSGKMFQLALQSGDTGVQSINSVIVTNGGTAMTAGAFNVLVMRRLVSGRIKIANDTHALSMIDSGMPEVFDTSALFLKVDADSTSTGVPEVFFDIIG